jgi:hypothetical protein
MAGVSPGWEATMTQLKAFIICCAVLYGLDAFLFHGWYTTAIRDVMRDAAFQVYVRW